MRRTKRTTQSRVTGRFQPASVPTESHSHVARTEMGGTALHSQSNSSLLSRYRHSRWWNSHHSSVPTSTFLRSLRSRPVTTLLRYYGRSDSCPALIPTGQVSLIHVTWSSDPSVSNHPCAPHGRFRTLPLNSVDLPLPGLGFTIIWQARRSHRPNRVSYRTDGPFTSGCSPPRLTTTQLPLVTGRRAYAWEGLSPP